MQNDLLIIKSVIDKNMYDKIVQSVSKKKITNHIIMAVDTTGGDPMFAFRSMKYLRSEYKHISFIVFDMSMSAGTLMALGSDVIFLSNGACLGPLDLQVSHPNPSDDTMISALDVRDTVKQTVLEAAQTMKKILIYYLQDGMPKSQAYDTSRELVTKLYGPIMDKIDPYHLHESYRNAELGSEYGSRLLLSGMFDDEKKAATVSAHLANDYINHGYAIMEEEAKSLGLNVKNILEFKEKETVKNLYDATMLGSVKFINAKTKKEKTNV